MPGSTTTGSSIGFATTRGCQGSARSALEPTRYCQPIASPRRGYATRSSTCLKRSWTRPRRIPEDQGGHHVARLRLDEPVDIVASAFVAEHLPSPEAFHLNVLKMLRPGGVALPLFPTLYVLPFVLNRTLPASTTDRVLARFQRFRESEGNDGKFTAYYRWCRGPAERQLHRLRDIGHEVVAYRGYFGHGYYLHLGIPQPAGDAQGGASPEASAAGDGRLRRRGVAPAGTWGRSAGAGARASSEPGDVSTGTKRQLDAGWT